MFKVEASLSTIVFPRIGNRNRLCGVTPLMIKAAMPKKSDTTQELPSNSSSALIKKLLLEPPCPVTIISNGCVDV